MRYNSFKTRTKALAPETGVKLSSLRETAAKALGFHDLHDLQRRLDKEEPQRAPAVAAEEISRRYGLDAEQVLACLDPTLARPAISDSGQPLGSFGLWDVYGDHLEHRRNGYWFGAERLLRFRVVKPPQPQWFLSPPSAFSQSARSRSSWARVRISASSETATRSKRAISRWLARSSNTS